MTRKSNCLCEQREAISREGELPRAFIPYRLATLRLQSTYPEGESKKHLSLRGTKCRGTPQIKSVILSASEISHRTIALPNKPSLRGKRSDEAISREGEYYVLLSPIVILSAAKYPTTKVKSICPSVLRWDSSLSFRMTYKKAPSY